MAMGLWIDQNFRNNGHLFQRGDVLTMPAHHDCHPYRTHLQCLPLGPCVPVPAASHFSPPPSHLSVTPGRRYRVHRRHPTLPVSFQYATVLHI